MDHLQKGIHQACRILTFGPPTFHCQDNIADHGNKVLSLQYPALSSICKMFSILSIPSKYLSLYRWFWHVQEHSLLKSRLTKKKTSWGFFVFFIFQNKISQCTFFFPFCFPFLQLKAFASTTAFLSMYLQLNRLYIKWISVYNLTAGHEESSFTSSNIRICLLLWISI